MLAYVVVVLVEIVEQRKTVEHMMKAKLTMGTKVETVELNKEKVEFVKPMKQMKVMQESVECMETAKRIME